MKHRDSTEVGDFRPDELPRITLGDSPDPALSLDTEQAIAAVEFGLEEHRPTEDVQIRLTKEEMDAHFRRAR